MHTLIIQESRIVYADPQSFDATGTRIYNAFDPRITTANATAVTVDALPPDFRPWQWTWDGEKPVIKPECHDAWLGGIKDRKLKEIDAETSAAILAGFTCEATPPDTGQPELLHFSYDEFDQQNFSDAALSMQLAAAASGAIPTSTPWNAYRNHTADSKGELVILNLTAETFLPIYAAALNHKATQMAIGGQRKAAVAAAQTVEEVEAI